MPQRLLIALACAATAACASGPDAYPSLAIRDAERVSGTLQPAEPYVPTPAAPAVLANAATLVEQAAAAHESYRGKLAGARSAVEAARGAGFGSEPWAAASVAIAGLETERSRAMIALADLDRLAVAAATAIRSRSASAIIARLRSVSSPAIATLATAHRSLPMPAPRAACAALRAPLSCRRNDSCAPSAWSTSACAFCKTTGAAGVGT